MVQATKISIFWHPICLHNTNMTLFCGTMIPGTSYTMVPGTKYRHITHQHIDISIPNNKFLSAREAIWTLTLVSGMLTSAGGDPKNRWFCYHGHNIATYHHIPLFARFQPHFTMVQAIKISIFWHPTCLHNANMTPFYATMIPGTRHTMVPGTKYRHITHQHTDIWIPNNQFLSAREALQDLTPPSGTLTSAGGDPKNRWFCYHGQNILTYHQIPLFARF